MLSLRCIVLAALAAAGAAQGPAPAPLVTPVQKVITLLEDLKAQVEAEGTAEASSYDQFACFCKDTTSAKSEAITIGQDNIDLSTATIEEKTATKEEKTTELEERTKEQEVLNANLTEAKAEYTKALAEYEATTADLTKALSSLEKAIAALEAANPGGPSLLAIKQTVEKSLALADALSLIDSSHKKKISAFLQQGVDPSDPEYKFHSQSVVDLMKELQTQFTSQKEEVDAQWATTKEASEALQESLQDQIDSNEEAMSTLRTDIGTLTEEIATARQDLADAEAALKDDSAYLKDLTVQCEGKAKDWDQRSQTRADEIAAIEKALAILTDQVQSLDEEVNKRALLEVHAKVPVQAAPHAASFLQATSTKARVRSLLLASSSRKKDAAVAILRKEATRLSSPVLSALATKIQGDPLAKVKTLIQDLIERLLRESTAEANKKGFCDQEIGKAEKDRDFRLADIKKLNAELIGLEAKKDSLEVEITELNETIPKLEGALSNATEIRATEKADNAEAVTKAKEGATAVTEAIQILKEFYQSAAKAKVFLQASPVDEDTSGPGFEGAYKGQQEASTGIIGLLEVIKSDFERTVAHTIAAEKKAYSEYVEFEQQSKSDIAAKSRQVTLQTEELGFTNTNLQKKMNDLQTASGLLDDAVKTIEGLKPMCIDTGMSYADKTAKREEEIDALKQALCALDPEGVEAECGGR